MKTLLTLFRSFWNENGPIITDSLGKYKEAIPQLILQVFLQRIVNGGGYINREYALGRKRTDIMIKWKYPPTPNSQLPTPNSQLPTPNYQNIVLEIKTINKKQSYQTIKATGLEQTAEYARLCGVKEAQLLIFDKDKHQKWAENEPNEIEECDGVKIEIWKFK